MSYFMRYIFTGTPANLEQIEAALHDIDPQFSIQFDPGVHESGDLYYGSEVFGEIAFNRTGDDIFTEDIDELRELVESIDDPLTPLIRSVLDHAQSLVALRVLQAGHENQDIVEQLWDWLFDHHPGVLQVDEEGFYDAERLILPTTRDE
jgi:hypothetical protein